MRIATMRGNSYERFYCAYIEYRLVDTKEVQSPFCHLFATDRLILPYEGLNRRVCFDTLALRILLYVATSQSPT